MTKRTLAAATLAALPLATGALRADCIRTVDTAAATRSVAGHAPGPQWSYVIGESLEGPLLLACPNQAWGCLIYIM